MKGSLGYLRRGVMITEVGLSFLRDIGVGCR